MQQLGFTALTEITMAAGGADQPVFRVLKMPVGPHIISSVSIFPFPWAHGQTPRRARCCSFARLRLHGPGEMNDSTAGGGCRVGAELHTAHGSPYLSVQGRVPLIQPSGMFLGNWLWITAIVVYATHGRYRQIRHTSSRNAHRGDEVDSSYKDRDGLVFKDNSDLALHPLTHIH